jgi:hypothetical protein
MPPGKYLYENAEKGIYVCKHNGGNIKLPMLRDGVAYRLKGMKPILSMVSVRALLAGGFSI